MQILFILSKEFEHVWILVSMVGLETNPFWILRDDGLSDLKIVSTTVQNPIIKLLKKVGF
jgi:hypothetical protein